MTFKKKSKFNSPNNRNKNHGDYAFYDASLQKEIQKSVFHDSMCKIKALTFLNNDAEKFNLHLKMKLISIKFLAVAKHKTIVSSH